MIKAVHYQGSYPSLGKMPSHTTPQYAFIGRSNVGKSSLINMLTGRKALARVSKQPGKTQMINLFLVDGEWLLVDLPGYGYAKRSKKMRQQWRTMVTSYLRESPGLITAFLLLDASISPQRIDLDFMNWMGEERIPFAIVYTKVDRIRKSHRSKHMRKFREALLESWEMLPPQFMASSVTGEGQEALLSYIEELNESLKT